MESKVCWAICLVSIYSCIFLISHSHNHKKDSDKQYVQYVLPAQAFRPTSPAASLSPCPSRWSSRRCLQNSCARGWEGCLRQVSGSARGRHQQSPRPSWAPQAEHAPAWSEPLAKQENTDLRVSVAEKVQPHTLDSWWSNSSFSNSNSILR